MSPETLKLEQSRIEVLGIMEEVERFKYKLYCLSRESEKEIGDKFHSEVTNGLKSLVALAENIEAGKKLSESLARKI